MTSKAGYYITRIVVATAAGALFWLAGLPWWGGLIVGVVLLGFFIWIPRSGRYVAHFSGDTARLQRDERMQAIRDQAARNALLGMVLALAGTILYYGLIVPGDVPVTVLSLILALGTVIYAGSDYWLRRP